MPKTRLISPGSIPNHKLLKNLQLQDNYISNDGGDEGISIQDDGDVIINGNTKLYLNDAGGEYLNSDGTDLNVASGRNVNILASGGIVTFATGDSTVPLFIATGTKTGSNLFDTTVYITETLNLGSGEAGGSDIHYGLRYVQTQTDVAGWNSVYLMHLSGGTAAKTFAVQGDGKVGIGEVAPQDTLEVNGTVLVKDALKFTQDDGNEFIDSQNDGYLDIGATTAIRLEAPTLCEDKLYFTQTDGNEFIDSQNDGYLDIGATTAIRLEQDTIIESTKKLYFNDAGGEYISGDGDRLTLTTGNDLILLAGEPDGYVFIGKSAEITTAGTNDATLLVGDTLNVPLPGGQSPFGNHYGVWYQQTQTNIGKYSAVYLMYLKGTSNNSIFNVDWNAQTTWDINTSGNDAENSTCLHIDFDRTVATAETNAHNDIGIDLDVNSASLGTSSATGMDIDVVGATTGTHTVTGIDITTSGSDKHFGLKINNPDNTSSDGTEADFINYSSAETGNYFYMNTYTNGETTLGTIDSGGLGGTLNLAPNGKLAIKSGISEYSYFQKANPYSLFQIWGYDQTTDYFKIEVEADAQTTITTFDDGGADAHLTLDIDGDIYLDAATGVFRFYRAGDTDDSFKLTVVGGTGATELRTVSDAADGHLSIVADGHVEFDGCGVGFDKVETTFSDNSLTSSGSTHDTDFDFRQGNKIECSVTADFTNANLIFPNTSGNFLLILIYSGDHDITNWKAYEHDVSAATNADVFWPGGAAPATTSTGVDIFSFFWDADRQACYGVGSLDFQN